MRSNRSIKLLCAFPIASNCSDKPCILPDKS